MILDDKAIDEHILSSLYLVLELEIAIRHAFVHHKTTLDRLRCIRAEIADFCMRLDGRLESDWVAHIVLETVQTNETLLDRLPLPLPILSDNEVEVISSKICDVQADFYKDIQKISAEMSEYEFLISDLSDKNDLMELFYWWNFISDEKNRMKYNLRGRNGDISFLANNEINTFPMPCNRPKLKLAHEGNYEICIKGDEAGQEGEQHKNKKLLLSIDIDKNCHNFDEIIEKFKLELIKYQLEYNCQQMESRGVKNLLTPIEMPNILKINSMEIKKSISRKFRKDHISIILTGLICWDLHVCNGLTIDAAYEAVANMYDESIKNSDFQERAIRTINKNYNEVRERIESKAWRASA